MGLSMFYSVPLMSKRDGRLNRLAAGKIAGCLRQYFALLVITDAAVIDDDAVELKTFFDDGSCCRQAGR